jgi:hypothetical protein
MADGLPCFGIVTAIVCFANSSISVLQLLKTQRFNTHLRSYAVEFSNEHGCWSLEMLKDFHPTSVWNVYYEGTANNFEQTRYLLM